MSNSNLNSLFDITRRDLVLEEVFSIIKKASCYGNFIKILKTIAASVPKIIIIKIEELLLSHDVITSGIITYFKKLDRELNLDINFDI